MRKSQIVLLGLAWGMLGVSLLRSAESPGAPAGAETAPPTPDAESNPGSAPIIKAPRSHLLDGILPRRFVLPPPKPEDRSWLEDPFGSIEREMAIVVLDLEKGETTRPVTVEQPQLIQRFDQLIELLEKSKKGGAGATATANPSAPAGESSLAAGPGGRGEMRSAGNSRRKWAELTPQEREKILQSRTQGFPPGYEELLQDYFLRLATEQVAPVSETKDDAPKPEPR